MNFFERRRVHKIVKHALHEAKHALHMRGDIAAQEDLDALREGIVVLKDAWARKHDDDIEAALNAIGGKIDKVLPAKPHAKMREHVEILVVALAVAMGFRAYFIQPFKIPTGSMQPTLYGITVDESSPKTIFDSFPLNLAQWIVTGEMYTEIRAKATGVVSRQYEQREDGNVYTIGGMRHRVPNGMHLRLQSPNVVKGQLLAAGRVRRGDHIFVNKLKYNFVRPTRGDIFVFDTDEIDHPQIRKDTFYIKRMVGMPGEAISIDPPYLVADGKRVTEPYAFDRLLHDAAGGYIGYILPPYGPGTPVKLATRESVLQLGKGEYLPLGDNTRSSLDGRYFGAVPERSIVGPAFMVYWPFGKRWGFVQ